MAALRVVAILDVLHAAEPLQGAPLGREVRGGGQRGRRGLLPAAQRGGGVHRRRARLRGADGDPRGEPHEALSATWRRPICFDATRIRSRFGRTSYGIRLCLALNLPLLWPPEVLFSQPRKEVERMEALEARVGATIELRSGRVGTRLGP